MAGIAGAEFGITQNQPYGGYSFFLSDAQYTEVPKFVPLYADRFSRIRCISDVAPSDTYPNNQALSEHIWLAALKAYKPSIYILHGSTNNSLSAFQPRYYVQYLTYLMQEALWAEQNHMNAFCVENEALLGNSHITNAMVVSTINRVSNVVTVTFGFVHGLTTGDYIYVFGANTSNYNIADSDTADTVQCTVIDSTTITYPAAGADGTTTGTVKLTWSTTEVIRKIKALCVSVRTVFHGLIEINESQGHTDPWIFAGITPGVDADLFGVDVYGDGTGKESSYISFKSEVDKCFAKFGTNLIIGELNVVQDSGNQKQNGLDHRDKDFEYWADLELIRRYKYLLSLGITQIYLFHTGEYPLFCNIWPMTTVDNAYYDGDFKPVIDKLLYGGEGVDTVLVGTNSST